jgi:hypothetical protein
MDVAPEEAITGAEEVAADLAVLNPVLAPHLTQNIASSGS